MTSIASFSLYKSKQDFGNCQYCTFKLVPGKSAVCLTAMSVLKHSISSCHIRFTFKSKVISKLAIKILHVQISVMTEELHLSLSSKVYGGLNFI